MSHRSALAAALALWLAAPLVSRAQDPGPAFDAPSVGSDAEARALFANGQRLYDEGRYEQAIVAFSRAYELSERPALLYNLANAYERLGDIQAAVEALNRYRVFAPVDDQDVLLARVQALERRLAERPTAPAPVPVGAVTPQPMPAPLQEPVRRSPAPWIMTGLGVATAVAGSSVAAGTWATSRVYLENGEQGRWEKTRPVNNVGVGAAVAGGAVGATGLVWAFTRP